ncbi:flagellar basal body P-ring formation chaperone FlgA [Massilia horti]|uniref:Flagella basal body P-ring formation protein FlgA n=1 Tax=Massilia horti TaxID=2562153 RepID=A0A4Y9SW07_9BURK|nr:flagellar basal body P-ring formation chaperone FlgA [Massilia horti]TFW29697.1 flagellar basal body P-ring formation protein FlgA [Massilia horti]
MNSFHKATIVFLVYLAFATVADAAQPISSQIEHAARAQLERQLASAGLSEPRFELDVVAARPAPPCAQPVTVEALDTRQSARMRFVARCPDPGGWRYEYLVRAKVSALVAVALVPVAANEPLTNDAIALERRDITNVPDPVGDASLAAGQSSRRVLRAGDILRSSQLAAPILVKRGEQVVMLARREGIEVSTSGEALDAGGRGATVRVKNNASGQVVRMRVTGVGTVEPLEAAVIR